MDDIVKEQAPDPLSTMLPKSVREAFRAQIQRLMGPPIFVDEGFAAPLDIFLELQVLLRIIVIVRKNLESLAIDINGAVVMTTDFPEDLPACVSKIWAHIPSGTEISLLMPPDMLDR